MNEFSTYLKDIERLPDFREDPVGVPVLVKRMRAGDKKAKLSLIESTLKYIAEMVIGYCNKYGAWQNILDLVQEANTEVSAKIAEYDQSKASLDNFIGFRSYIAFVRFWYKSKIVNVTEHGRKFVNLLRRAHSELTAVLGREPTLEELSEYVGREESQVYAVQKQPGVSILGIGEVGEDENGVKVISLDSLPFAICDPFQAIEATELRDLLINCLGEEDTDLLLTYLDYGTDGFRDLYFRLQRGRISAAAARKAKQRILDKLKNCRLIKDRFFPEGEIP